MGRAAISPKPPSPTACILSTAARLSASRLSTPMTAATVPSLEEAAAQNLGMSIRRPRAPLPPPTVSNVPGTWVRRVEVLSPFHERP
jgi:hypothetical protein